MPGFMVRMFTDYPWMAWLTAVLAVCGLAYAGVWVHDLASAGSSWLAYRRLVWRSKAAVRRQIADNPGWDCAVCRDREALLLEALGPGDLERLVRGDDPPEYQHDDGPDGGYDWEGPGEDWSPGLAWGPGMPVPNPMAGLAEVLKRAHDLGLLDDDQLPDGPPADASEAPEERCTNRDCDLYGFIHRPPCRLSPTMPAACYPDGHLDGWPCDYLDGPAMPPQPWSGLEASLEVLARGDDDKPLHPAIQADLEAAGFRAHDTTEGLVDTSYTRAQAREVQAMITDGVIPTGRQES